MSEHHKRRAMPRRSEEPNIFMSLPSNYTQAVGRIPDLFGKIRDGQAPDQLTQQTLKDWGFVSANDRALPSILKTLGFLSPDGRPTSRYHEYRDHSRSRRVLGEALKSAYKDIFLIKEFPGEQDKDAIQGKFKSYHNTTDRMARLMTNTFYALLDLADLKGSPPVESAKAPVDAVNDELVSHEAPHREISHPAVPVSGLHYNIQIHLPATKDIEVFNAIFKSLKLHLINE